MEPLSQMMSLAIAIVVKKYPDEFVNKAHMGLVFDLIEMIVNELNMNADIFYGPYFDQFVDVKDISK